MRALTTLSIAAITALVSVACTGDQADTTAPSPAPSFKSLSATKTYRFSFTCTGNFDPEPTISRADMNVYHSNPPSIEENGVTYTGLSLACGQQSDLSSVYSFDYDIRVRDLNSGSIEARCQTQKNGVSYTIKKPGTFTCTSEGGALSGTLTVTEST